MKRVANQSNKKLLVKQAKAVVATYNVIVFCKGQTLRMLNNRSLSTCWKGLHDQKK